MLADYTADCVPHRAKWDGSRAPLKSEVIIKEHEDVLNVKKLSVAAMKLKLDAFGKIIHSSFVALEKSTKPLAKGIISTFKVLLKKKYAWSVKI